MTLCTDCQHPLNSHSPDTGHCNVAGESFVCDCGQPVIVSGEEVIGYLNPDVSGEGDWPGFTSFRDDVA